MESEVLKMVYVIDVDQIRNLQGFIQSLGLGSAEGIWTGVISQPGGLEINAGGDIIFYANNAPNKCDYRTGGQSTQAFHLVYDMVNEESVIYIERNTDRTKITLPYGVTLFDAGRSYGWAQVQANNFSVGTGCPVLAGTVLDGHSVMEILMEDSQPGDLVITGNLNVGRVDGGLSVNGIIGLSGDLSGNCYLQFGTASATS